MAAHVLSKADRLEYSQTATTWLLQIQHMFKDMEKLDALKEHQIHIARKLLSKANGFIRRLNGNEEIELCSFNREWDEFAKGADKWLAEIIEDNGLGCF